MKAALPALDVKERPKKVLSIRQGGWAADVKIKGQCNKMLVDSGAMGTFLGLDAFKEMGIPLDQLEDVQEEFEMADGTPL